ncbi:MAG: hypothetical protein HKL80_09290 [Acidimicrobiales bacterium]|nr:hypothetical protein [Acidimicrobiales bacterium]
MAVARRSSESTVIKDLDHVFDPHSRTLQTQRLILRLESTSKREVYLLDQMTDCIELEPKIQEVGIARRNMDFRRAEEKGRWA